MYSIHGSPVEWPPKELRRKASEVSINHPSVHSSDSSSSAPPSPKSPSPRAIRIATAFEHVCDLSIFLQTALSATPYEGTITTKNRVKEFQDAVTNLFDELRHLPNDVPPTPVLISAIQGCSFEVHCFGSSAEVFRIGFGCEGDEERQKQLVAMLKEAMTSLCMLLEFVAQAIEDAGAARKRLEVSAELDTGKAELGSGSGDWPSMEGRPLSWLVHANTSFDPAPPVSSSTKSCVLLTVPTRNQRNSNPSPSLPNISRSL
jgi:hypothetical protein